MSEPVFMFDGKDPQMVEAYQAAQATFKYFWRELYWERRRIVPGLDMAAIKLPFTDGPRDDGNPEFEHMWVDEVEFDGEQLAGVLLNAPNWLTSVAQGNRVETPFAHLTDWMFTCNGKAYGGHTVNLMRSRMGERERQAHDDAWGLDFGHPAVIRTEIVREQGQGPPPLPGAPAVFRDHPMCTNMLAKVEGYLRQDPSAISSPDDRGWTLLHTEALAGNLGIIKLLLRLGADLDAVTPEGWSAASLAGMIGWEEIAAYLEGEARGEQAGGG